MSRDQIIDAAKAQGLDSFTMASVAEHLGVSTPALYSHVSSRADILEAVTESLLDHVDAALVTDEGWRPFLQSMAEAVRTSADGSRIAVLTQMEAPSGRAIELVERGLTVLLEAGFDPVAAAEALWLVTRVALSAGSPSEPSIEHHRRTAPDLVQPPATFPSVARVVTALDGRAEIDSFESDIETVLDGIELRLSRSRHARQD